MRAPDADTESQSTLRRANVRRALQLVFDGGGTTTRAAIARRTGLTPATASSLVAELINDHLVVEGARATSTGGKPATTLSVETSTHVILIIVVRKLEATAAVLNLDSAVVAEETVQYSPEDCRVEVDALVARVAERYHGRILAAAVQLPGATDGRVVLESVQLGWRDVPLADDLERLLGIEVLLVNDVDAEAVAEAAVDPEPAECQLFLHIGRGIGASVMLNGTELLRTRARLGEVGHVVVIFGESARECRCGMRGCLESAASFGALTGDEYSIELSPAEVAALLNAVDDEQMSIAAVAIGRVIKLLAAMIDPTEVVLGGSAHLLGTRFLDAVRAEAAYVAKGTAATPIRYTTAHDVPYIGTAQIALSNTLGVHWTPEQLTHARQLA